MAFATAVYPEVIGLAVCGESLSPNSTMEKSLAEIAAEHDTDKAVHLHYLEAYERHFASLRSVEMSLFELGIKNGGSLLMWRDYFPLGRIAGLDIEPASVPDDTGRITTYQGMQQDTALLHRIAKENAPNEFDIIIDDCSHIGVLARESFWYLFKDHLKSGGWYVIEDWGTGYWDSWVDGVSYRNAPKRFSPPLYKANRIAARLAHAAGSFPLIGSFMRRFKAVIVARQFTWHDYGMVGFVKELIDELGMPDRTHPEYGIGTPTESRFSEMHFTQSHLFIRKV
ncbi:MAG TPA: hypothetical protein VGO43_15295 [Pyrinomonadaceae bacterium]|nr:hypothetical protein [Pyrinomonadaceae bacterium]